VGGHRGRRAAARRARCAAAPRRAGGVRRTGTRPAWRSGGPVCPLPRAVHRAGGCRAVRPWAVGGGRRAAPAGRGASRCGGRVPAGRTRHRVVRRGGAAPAAAPLPGQAPQGGRARAAGGAGGVPARLAERGSAARQRAPGSPLAGRAGRRWRPTGPDAVYDVVDQLAGAAVPASALETLVLPGRIPGYQPAVLDELTAAGEVVWAGAGGLPGSDGWVVLAPAPAAPLLLPPPVEITMTPVHDAVLEVLAGGGGLFFRMLADRVAGMLTDHDWRGLSDTAVAAAIWDLVWAGRLTNDTLAPLRTVLGSGRPVYEGIPAGPSAGREPGPDPVPEANPVTGA